MTDQSSDSKSGGGLGRRRLLFGGAGALATAGVGAAAVKVTDSAQAAQTAQTPSPNDTVVPFYGEHQAGIATAVQDRMHVAAFDIVEGADRDSLIRRLKTWTASA